MPQASSASSPRLTSESISAGPCAPASQASGLTQAIGSAPISPSAFSATSSAGCGNLGSIRTARREARRPRSLGQAASRYRRAAAGERRRASRRSGLALAVRDDAVEGAGAGCRAGWPPESFQWQKWPALEPRAAGSARCHADHAAGRREEPSRDPAAAPLTSAQRRPDPQ
jgi:hypothetical protein